MSVAKSEFLNSISAGYSHQLCKLIIAYNSIQFYSFVFYSVLFYSELVPVPDPRHLTCAMCAFFIL